MNNKFGETLRGLMEQRNVSGRQLAQRIGVAHKSVQEWLDRNKFSSPRDPTVLKQLATYFDVSIHFLLFGEEDPKSLIGEILEKSELHTGLYEISVRRVTRRGNR